MNFMLGRARGLKKEQYGLHVHELFYSAYWVFRLVCIRDGKSAALNLVSETRNMQSHSSEMRCTTCYRPINTILILVPKYIQKFCPIYK